VGWTEGVTVVGRGASGGGCGSRFGCSCGFVSRVLAIVKWAGEGRQNTPPCQVQALVGDGRRSGRYDPNRHAASIQDRLYGLRESPRPR